MPLLCFAGNWSCFGGKLRLLRYARNDGRMMLASYYSHGGIVVGEFVIGLLRRELPPGDGLVDGVGLGWYKWGCDFDGDNFGYCFDN